MTIEPGPDRPPVNGSDAVFAAVAAARWLADGAGRRAWPADRAGAGRRVTPVTGVRRRGPVGLSVAR